MRRFILLAGAAALAAVSPALAQGKGHGQGHGGGKGGQAHAGHPGGGKGPKGDRGGGEMRGHPGRGHDGAMMMRDGGQRMVVIERGKTKDKGKDRGAERWVRQDRVIVRDARPAVVDVVAVETRGGRGLIAGCPPGLAAKNNGCLPPGQARKLAGYADPYANWYGDPRWRDDDYRYADGYLYRIDPATRAIGGFVPLLGGALFGGNVWPTSYADANVSPYWDRYYGYDDALDYRSADNAIFGVDPQSGAIQAIAALLTGDSWSVGSRMPSGYDLYNVPSAYRDRYSDGPDAWYRYSDGYVYQVDPTSQLVRQAIELLV